MEVFDLYDENRIRTGETMVRGNSVPTGRFRLVVHICFFNGAGQMLIQRRQPFKSHWPGMWDLSVGGCVVHGESSRQGAEREVREEIGYPVDLTGIRPTLSVNFSNGFDDYYLLRQVPENLHLQQEEVSEVRWAAQEEILSAIDSKTFIPYQKSLICLLFALKDNPSVRIWTEDEPKSYALKIDKK